MKTRRTLGLFLLAALGIVCWSPSLIAEDEPPYPIQFDAVEEVGHATTFQIALGDLDADGDLDAVLANQGRNDSCLLLNDGAGQFAATDQLLTQQGHGVGLGDLDGDGDLDIFIACAYAFGRSLPSKIYFNDGHARFTDSGQDLGDTSISANLVRLVDIDADGDLDAFVAYLTLAREFISHVYLNDGSGQFVDSEYSLPFGTLFHDLDGDGDIDAMIKEPGSMYVTLLNDGHGGLDEVWRADCAFLQYEPFSIAFGDLDGDGDIDAMDTNGTWMASGQPNLLLGNGDGSFEIVTTELLSTSAAWPILRDFNGDGTLDVFLSILNEDNQLWLNDGAARFTDSLVRVSGVSSCGPGVGDLDGDGDLDLFIPAYGTTGGPSIVWLRSL
ncbi:MAG: VCBS repeat-containing protein [Candidatus Atribacteria bacterium]|nr:MAG: VCBS repeat-containing protein [Candidatus Atribacteria bacterium]